LQYLQGQILEKEAVNMTNIPKVVPGSDNQSLQHFISESSWDDERAITELQKYAAELIGDENNASLHIDESGFPKQGNHSVGVARQYCGRLGKVENCQVGVFLGYVNGGYRTLIDKRLYLPKGWIDDAERCRKCNVPENIEFKTKADLGLEMVLKAKKRGVPFGWVGVDCFYGEQPEFLDGLNGNDIIYVADIPCSTRGWLERPKMSDGLETQPTEVRDIVQQLNESQWKHVFIRDTERKELWCQIACLRVYPVRNRLPGEETWLIIRKNDGENEIK
jgi:SRSO17 transposase